MINANELRIGNLVNTRDKYPMQISAINDDDEYINVRTSETGYIEYNYNEIEPIPLTEEILLKIEGMSLFEYEGMKTYTLNESLNDSMGGIGFSDGDLMIYEQNGVFACNGINFKYLHDLQNFAFYELGKKELEINL